MDSLNNCWRVGQTTSLSSANVAATNPPLRLSPEGSCGVVAAVSSEVGVVTNRGPVLTPV